MYLIFKIQIQSRSSNSSAQGLLIVLAHHLDWWLRTLAMKLTKRLPAIFVLAVSLIQILSIRPNPVYANQIIEEVVESEGSVRPKSSQVKSIKRSLPSRLLRKESTLQLAFHLTPLIPLIQSGVDVDLILDEEITIGLSRNKIMTIWLDYDESIENTAVHLKQFLGNSFYVKPSVGIQTKTEAGWMIGTRVTKNLAAQMEIGNEWFWGEHIGVNLSYLGLGMTYDHKNHEIKPTGLLPSIRIFGAFWSADLGRATEAMNQHPTHDLVAPLSKAR